MKLQKISTKIAEKIRIAKLERREAQVKKYLSFERIKNPELKQEIYDAREVLANYAKANNVRINLSEGLTEKDINIGVIHFNTMNCAVRDVPATKESLVIGKTLDFMTTDKDGINHIRKGYHSTEDTFLRRIYKTVEHLTNIVTTQK